MTLSRPFLLRASRAALLLGAGLALAACHAERIVQDSYPQRVAQRHPIVLSEGPERLDLPVGAGGKGLTDRQRDDIRAFAADWRKSGRGPVGMMVPSGGAGDFAAPAVRTTLAAAGVPSTTIVSQRYPAGADSVAVIKLGFVKLKAGVPHPCGLWPDDIGYGGGDWYGESENREYWNFGCATQQNLAAQVADPEDLARPRRETPNYAARRTTVVDKYRQGEDSTTSYRQQDAKVSSVGGGN
ncbi:CpaD family pilus assembly protein [Chelatococcus sambhunathii]|uniref:CpaD family pilus assembly protein n=1 Tax=Chelatococcus sambhunathii TaxID=363953 RepID=A0ABU1DDT0_9HYPH|nr:CpaD family pilus assembly protein [Chelatococcus sambhunathii]MDR4306270.1 CpaD family pilus assembly protein [Chelatococcus sambhunathii]